MVKRGLAKAMMAVRSRLFARIPILASLNDISLDRGSWLCSSKEEHWPVEPEVAVSGSVRVAYIIKHAPLAQRQSTTLVKWGLRSRNSQEARTIKYGNMAEWLKATAC